MAESSIPVDLFNPGQVFASLGILEVADTLLGEAYGGFCWDDATGAKFRVRAFGTEPPVERVMRFLGKAKIITKVPSDSANLDKWKDGWGKRPEIVEAGEPFPFRDPNSPATLPVVLSDGAGNEVTLDYWGDSTRRDNVKFWAGAGGMPGAAILRNALNVVDGKMRQHANNPFALSGAQTNSFRFDWRRDYVPVQVGFSPNKHKGKSRIQMLGFPLVEVLAAIGVSHARPSRTTKLEYRYGVLGGGESTLLDLMFHRAALGSDNSPIPGHPFRRFVMRLDWPGRESQARCITQVTEEETIE